MKVRVSLEKLLRLDPALAAEALGLEPESDEAAKVIQELLDGLYDQERAENGRNLPRGLTVDGWEV